MMALAISMFAGAVVAATPVTPMPWFEFTDYPMKAFEKKVEGVTHFQLLIAPDGSIKDCDVTRSAGNDELDRTTCFLATKRAKFSPARDANGRAVFGVYRSEAVWVLPENRLASEAAPDLEISVNQLPEGAIEPAAVKLAYSVDTSGNTSSCTVMPSSLKQPPVLVELGCKELLSHMPHAPVLNAAGQPVDAVRTGAVLFKPQS